jgi:hypothetical protein
MYNIMAVGCGLLCCLEYAPVVGSRLATHSDKKNYTATPISQQIHEIGGRKFQKFIFTDLSHCTPKKRGFLKKESDIPYKWMAHEVLLCTQWS